MIKKFYFPMKGLKRNRLITMYLPDDYYYQEKRYPVLYIQDGQNAFFDKNSFCGVSWGFLEYAQDMELDMILVGIDCNFEGFKRMDEYGPWPICEELSYQETRQEGMIIGGEGQDYVKWLIEELKVYIDAHYLTDSENAGIVGSSMGGVISAYAGLCYPNIFKKCACLSTAFWFYMNEFEELIESQDYLDDFRFYFDLGEFEGCGSEMIDEWYIETNNEMYQMLKGKVKHLDYRYFLDTYHNEEAWRKRVPLFMEFLYGED